MAKPAEALAKAGAEGRTRTDMMLPSRDFESRASAISPLRLYIIISNVPSEYPKSPYSSIKKGNHPISNQPIDYACEFHYLIFIGPEKTALSVNRLQR